MFRKEDPYSLMESGGQTGTLATEFSEAAVRKGFVRKVFGILFAQLALTTAVCALFMTTVGVQAYIMQNSWPLWTSLIITFGTLFAMICKPELARTFPHNYSLLALFTTAESVMVGSICMMSNPVAVLLAAGITTCIVAALSVYALQTKYDFTTAGGVLSGALVALILVSFIGIFFPTVKAVELLLSGAGAVLFACFLVVDIQMMMDGKTIQLSPDDYVLAALNLYLDIINLFLYILRILNASRDN